MLSIAGEPAGVIGGVDTHGEVHVAAAVDEATGGLVGIAEFGTTSVGYRQLEEWLRGWGPVTKVGVEGTGTYGAGLTRHLLAAGVEVVEVDRPDRSARRRRGKSDPVDAEAAARAVLSGRARTAPKLRNGEVEAIRLFRIVYRSAIKDRTAALNQFHSIVLTAPEAVREELRPLRTTLQLKRCLSWDTGESGSVVGRAARRCLQELAERINQLAAQANRAEAEMRRLAEQVAPALLDVTGVGVHVAAQLLITVGDNPDRIRSEAAFAQLCGVAPVPASSGKTQRHRLNQAGDRGANHALWRIAFYRLGQDQRTKTYAARRRAEGLSDRDIMRCLKRYIAREIHHILVDPPTPAPRGHDVALRRRELGITQIVLAERLGIHPVTLSQIENDRRHSPTTQRRAMHELATMT